MVLLGLGIRGRSSSLSGGFVISFAVSVQLRQCFVFLSSNLRVFGIDIDFRGVLTRICDLSTRDFHIFHLVTVEEMGNVDPTFSVCLDLFSEEPVSGQVGIGQVVLDLLFDRGV